jgi:hypothetical protein
MMAVCPVCSKLCVAKPAPRDVLGRPRVTVADHERLNPKTKTDDYVYCPGSGRQL